MPLSLQGGLVYLCFFLFGAGLLAPWNAFITAVDYFNYLWPVSRSLATTSLMSDCSINCPISIITFVDAVTWRPGTFQRLKCNK